MFEDGWSNEIRLKDLSAKREIDLLTFETPTERAEVVLTGIPGGERPTEKIRIERVNCFVDGKAVASVFEGDAHEATVGEGNASRHVIQFLRPDGPVPELRVGITHHQGPGTWSSTPHGFEEHPEPTFEEVFFHVMCGGSERALQIGRGMWHDGEEVDTVWPAFNMTFSTIPMGWHMVVGEPGVWVSYIWAYIARRSKLDRVNKDGTVGWEKI